jgi:hypothetical protein
MLIVVTATTLGGVAGNSSAWKVVAVDVASGW